jgi:hypothetical protein
LRHSAAALPDGGLLLVSESVLSEDFAGRQSANVKDLIMLIANEPGARERTLGEYQDFLERTGFDFVDVIRFEAPRDLIVARKRQGLS